MPGFWEHEHLIDVRMAVSWNMSRVRMKSKVHLMLKTP